jgi:hypothetical protein
MAFLRALLVHQNWNLVLYSFHFRDLALNPMKLTELRMTTVHRNSKKEFHFHVQMLELRNSKKEQMERGN